MESRPFPPSARRRALARRAGLHAGSPLLVGALACAAAVAAIGALGAAAASQLGAAIAAACGGGGTALAPADAIAAVGSLALPLLAAAALAAALGHFAQTRAGWLPRRHVPGAPALANDPATRARRAAVELAGALALGGVALGWLWFAAPRLAALPEVPLAGGALVAGALATFAIAWAALGVLDALVRHAAHAHALRMTAHDKREDDRLAGPDPRWRAHRARLARGASAVETIAGATVLVLGDDLAVAVAWDPLRRPVPTTMAAGRGARATQLLGLARRHRIPIHRDPRLAGALADTAGPIPERHWPRLAELVAALRRP